MQGDVKSSFRRKGVLCGCRSWSHDTTTGPNYLRSWHCAPPKGTTGIEVVKHISIQINNVRFAPIEIPKCFACSLQSLHLYSSPRPAFIAFLP